MPTHTTLSLAMNGPGGCNEGSSPDDALLHRCHRDPNRDALRNRLVTVKQWALEHNVPIICNEFGVYEASSRKDDRVRYYSDLIGLFGELEIPWQLWFEVIDLETGAVDPGYAKALAL